MPRFYLYFVNRIGDELIMGRQSVCTLRFEDKMISGRHCRIYKDKPDKNSNTTFQQPADSLQLIFLEDLRFGTHDVTIYVTILVQTEHMSMEIKLGREIVYC